MEDVFVHKLALCDSPRVGKGTRIWAFSHVMEGAVVGKDCSIGEHVFIENRVQIGDGCTVKNGIALWDCVTLERSVFLGPYVVFTNDFRPRAFLKRGRESFLPTVLKTGASVGANATIVCGVTIGEYAFVGAGTVVVKDVPNHTLLLGNPGRVVGRVCFCAARLDSKDFCKACQLPLSENSAERLMESLK